MFLRVMEKIQQLGDVYDDLLTELHNMIWSLYDIMPLIYRHTF